MEMSMNNIKWIKALMSDEMGTKYSIVLGVVHRFYTTGDLLKHVKVIAG